jgi:hypothetical protein
MRVICPACQKSINLPDGDAGQGVKCTECGHGFTAPEFYSLSPRPEPTVPVVAAAPVVVPAQSALGGPLFEATKFNVPVQTQETAPAFPPGAGPSSAKLPRPAGPIGPMKECTLVLAPLGLAWIPPVALTLCLFLSFFSNNGLFPGGYSAYTQNAWLALFASVSEDPVAEKQFKLKETVFDKELKTSWWMLPYLPALVFSTLLAWGVQIVGLKKIPLPPAVQGVWNYRHAILAGVACLALIALMAQWLNGFGLRNATYRTFEEKLVELKDASKTPEEVQVYEMRLRSQIDGFRIATTTWFRLAVLLHLTALVALAIEVVMDKRGTQPLPRITFRW